MVDFFQTALFWIESSKYVLLFVGCIFEGPVVMLASGFLFHLGQFSFWPMYAALVFGDFTADISWYCFGRFGTRSAIFKYGHIINLTPATLEKIENRFRKYHQKILIISKLTMGLGFAAVVLVVAGMFKVPFKNYVILNLIGGFIWTAFLLTIGYFFGNVYLLIPGSAKIIFACIILLVAIFGVRYANNYLATKEI
ncbi:MAG: DedA family protein [Candidatus Zambryskibacteria bacterium]|nr:DedA family protein [Candidatus Zambryskibacteria bacterium]